ncbi:MAG TPA: peptidylprolyl isomerase [Dehalococcoidales bacterium]|nr:peptidylprolyl isomerase [Dehalococcoidales bacterium]
MVKKNVEKPGRELTRRQLSHRRQQERRRRIITTAGIIIIALVVILVGVGWYLGDYRPRHETVIRVNDTEYDMNYYIRVLKLYGEGQSAENLLALTDEVAKVIQQSELVRQAAEKVGVTVSDNVVDAELARRNLLLSREYRDLVRPELLITKLRDEYFEKQVPLYGEQRHIMAMFLESENQTIEVEARLERWEAFTDLASELSLESFSRDKEGDLGWLPRGILTILLGTSVVDEYAFSAEVGVLSEPVYDEDLTKEVGYWLIQVMERDEDMKDAAVQALVLSSRQEADEVRAKLEAGGDIGGAFAQMAEEYSQLAVGNKGFLKSVAPGKLTEVFDKAVFGPELELQELSEPLRDETIFTKGGYWLIKVVERDENRPLEPFDRDLLKAKALDDWISELLADETNMVESYLDNKQKMWAVERALQD